MIYPVAPACSRAAHALIVQEPSGFSREEIERIRAVGDALEFTDVKLYGRYTPEMVKARGAHFRLSEETRWVYERIAARVAQINAESYRFDLDGFYENFYYQTYDASEAQHFNWHYDAGDRTPAPRKLSAVLHLSDPDEFEGGDFEVMVGMNPVAADKDLGLLTVFPSHRLHRVTPVTAGKRRTLVGFVGGPEFR